MMGDYSGRPQLLHSIHNRRMHLGGLSGYTFEEAASWGGVKQGIKVQLFSDATITVPLMVQALRVSGKRRKSVLVFDWSKEDLELRHIKRSGRWRVSVLTTFFLDAFLTESRRFFGVQMI